MKKIICLLVLMASAFHEAFREVKHQIIEMMSAMNQRVVIKIFAIFAVEGGKITHINEVWKRMRSDEAGRLHRFVDA